MRGQDENQGFMFNLVAAIPDFSSILRHRAPLTRIRWRELVWTIGMAGVISRSVFTWVQHLRDKVKRFKSKPTINIPQILLRGRRAKNRSYSLWQGHTYIKLC